MTREIEPALVESKAKRMLANAIARASSERGLSLRDLAERLGYRHGVVLSHMATGRAPIPIDRAEQLAHELGMDPAMFLRAVVEQRHPDVSWDLIASHPPSEAQEEILQMQYAIDASLDDLIEEQIDVMREVMADPNPRRRWLSLEELAALDLLRGSRSDGRK